MVPFNSALKTTYEKQVFKYSGQKHWAFAPHPTVYSYHLDVDIKEKNGNSLTVWDRDSKPCTQKFCVLEKRELSVFKLQICRYVVYVYHILTYVFQNVWNFTKA